MARNRARKADRRANAIDAGVPYSKVPTTRRDDGPQLQPCWEGCQSQYLAWRNASGSMSWCAWVIIRSAWTASVARSSTVHCLR